MGENNNEHNFITEKMWEPLLIESLCFYWGCPNISDYIHPNAYVLLDLNDFEKSFHIIKDAITNNLWEDRIGIIRAEKQKVLEYYGFFPTLERIIKEESNTYNKYFSFLKNIKLEKVCFIHSCHLQNVGTKILDSLLNDIYISGLFEKLDLIIIINIGEEIYYNKDKIKIINYSFNTQLFELPTIKLISEFSKYHANVKLLYLHTKGITSSSDNVKDWVDYMKYFMIDKHEDCIRKLNQYDAVGCNYLAKPYQHFSGNFWWANTNYLSDLNIQNLKVRHDAEWWVLSNTNNYHSVHNSNINHYTSSYSKTNYIS